MISSLNRLVWVKTGATQVLVRFFFVVQPVDGTLFFGGSVQKVPVFLNRFLV